jgi:carbonic anhydrase/acetyltransferase-like protein (isoleucine patch superfamily)
VRLHTVGPESIVRAGACAKQRDAHPARSVLDGFPACVVGTLAEAPGRPGSALRQDAITLIRRPDRRPTTVPNTLEHL